MRFDHHRGEGRLRSPVADPQRGIYYAGFSFSSCVVEVFGDRGTMTLADWHVARVKTTRTLTLLDLRGSGAMRAGSVAAIAKVADRGLSQAWARYFYETIQDYGLVDGIAYYNAHNDQDAVAIYERAATALECPTDQVSRLDDEALRPLVLDIALKNNLVLA
jgi:hypothetical protein